MILIWLGSFFLMVLSLSESQKAWAQISMPLQKKLWDKSFEVGLPRLFARALCLTLVEASPQKSTMTALALCNLRILNRRAGLLLMSLSNAGTWLPLLLALLFMNINGAFLLGLCALSLFSFLRVSRLETLFKLLLWLGLFFISSEMMMRHSMGWLGGSGEADLIFWLADGRWVAVLSLFFVALLVSLFIAFDYWTLCLSLVLLLASVLSLNGALALFAGERCARGFLIYWRGRRLNQDCRRSARNLGLAGVLGGGAAFLTTLFAKGTLGVGSSFGMAAGPSRTMDFVCLLVLFLVVHSAVQMIVGHFSAKRALDEVQEPLYFPQSWIQGQWLSEPAMIWAQEKLGQRIQEIRYHLKGLETFTGNQIPEPLRLRLQKEERELAQLQSFIRKP